MDSGRDGPARCAPISRIAYRTRSILATALCALLVSLTLWPTPAAASYINQYIDDTCNTGGPGSTQFFATGPPQFWFPRNFTGGPDGCMMFTWNEQTYDPQNGNEAFWYNCSASCDGYYNMYAFVPNINTTTTNAVYQLWTNGHNQPRPNRTMGVNQSPLNNVWQYLYGGDVFVAGNNGGSGNSGFVLLDDGTGEPSGTTQVGYDNFKYCTGPAGSTC